MTKSVEVYLLTFASGRCYIGVSCDLKRRLWAHAGSTGPVGRAWRKHGKPEVKVLARCDEEYGFWLEREAIRRFGTLAPAGYNLMDGGLGGRRMSVETRRQMSAARTGKPMPEHVKCKISAAKRGVKRIFSEEWRQNMAAARKGRVRGPLSEETKRKIAAAKLGVKRGPHSEETRRRISEARRLKGQ